MRQRNQGHIEDDRISSCHIKLSLSLRRRYHFRYMEANFQMLWEMGRFRKRPNYWQFTCKHRELYCQGQSILFI
jgi:hypothetical protein